MNLSNDPEQIIEKLHITTKTETDKRILEEAFNVFEKSAFQKQPKSGHVVRQNIFHNTLIKIAALAAVVVIIFAIFLNQDAKTDFGKIYNSLAKADNLCISTYLTGETQPNQQIWKTPNIKLFRIAKQNNIQYTLWDLSKKIKMTKFSSSNSIQSEPITEGQLSELEKSTTQSFGILSGISNISEIAQWTRIDDPNNMTIVPGSEIFELTWLEETFSESMKYRKTYFFVNTKNNLPLRVENYAKSKPGDQYELENFSVFTYPRENEVEAVVERVFNPSSRQSDKPQPIGTPGMQ